MNCQKCEQLEKELSHTRELLQAFARMVDFLENKARLDIQTANYCRKILSGEVAQDHVEIPD